MVCPKDWEPRHPQDFVKGVRDNQSVPVSRPEAPDAFVEIDYTLSPQIQDPTHDTVLPSDIFSRVATWVRGLVDSTTPTDSVALSLSFHLSDTVLVTDSFSRIVIFNDSFADAESPVNITDSISFVIVSGSPLNGAPLNTFSLNG